jgi:tetratricopeptide (TPR) repeat protein
MASEFTGYKMAVISDESQGRAILSGDYDRAIGKMTNKPLRFRGRFALCVAYAKTKDLQKAIQACDAAVADVTSQVSKNRLMANNKHPAMRRDLAIALSNRAVLFAIQGNLEMAQVGFEEAIKLSIGINEPQFNLAILEGTSTNKMAATF